MVSRVALLSDFDIASFRISIFHYKETQTHTHTYKEGNSENIICLKSGPK